jgi:hypothetical protein
MFRLYLIDLSLVALLGFLCLTVYSLPQVLHDPIYPLLAVEVDLNLLGLSWLLERVLVVIRDQLLNLIPRLIARLLLILITLLDLDLTLTVIDDIQHLSHLLSPLIVLIILSQQGGKILIQYHRILIHIGLDQLDLLLLASYDFLFVDLAYSFIGLFQLHLLLSIHNLVLLLSDLSLKALLVLLLQVLLDDSVYLSCIACR